jgi:hypothetical protein
VTVDSVVGGGSSVLGVSSKVRLELTKVAEEKEAVDVATELRRIVRVVVLRLGVTLRTESSDVKAGLDTETGWTVALLDRRGESSDSDSTGVGDALGLSRE